MATSEIVWYLLAAAVALFVTFRVWAFRRAVMGRVPPELAKRLVGEGATLVDVRTTREYQGGHLDGALNIPLHTLAGSLDRIPRGEPVVLYCLSGSRSARAARLLRAADFTSVYDLGPMTAYPG